MPTTLGPFLKRAAGEYQQRKAAAESQVVRWEYWSGPAYDPKPLYFERTLQVGLVKRGKRLKKPSPRGCAYAFDAKGRVVIDRQPKSDEPAYDEFFEYDDNGSYSAAYGAKAPHAVQYVTRQFVREGHAVKTEVLDADGRATFAEWYEHRGGRLIGITVVSEAGMERNRVKYDVVYEPDGRLRAIRRCDEGLSQPWPVYWNPEVGGTLDSIFKSLQKRLLDLIPKTIARARIREPAYCVAIAYDSENDELPPYLAVGLDSERQRWIASEGKGAKELVWNPAEFSRFEDGTLSLDGAAGFEDDCNKLLQLSLMKGALHIPTKLLNAVASDLNKRKWNGVVPTTDDFIVYAIDLEGEDFKKNLRAAVPEKKLKLLKSRRLI
jgi:hypothetical protein